MAVEYVSQVTLTVNGQEITDFKSVAEGERELRKKVKLMNSQGLLKTTPDYKVTVEYVVPKSAAEFDFDEVEDGTLTIDLGNDTKILYTGVATMKVGEAKYDGENETTKSIELGATGRKLS
ncbi:MAG: hypothetical protein OEV42_15160 [Deltaproteobacteria bacterium]|nr:hypothetical protein [Deltaproteobacteria bacterium]